VAKGVEAEPPFEPGALLPEVERVPDLAARQAPAESADEERRVRCEALSSALLPGAQLLELRPHEVGQDDLLDRGLARAALEHTQDDPSLRATLAIEDVAQVEREQLVFAQARAEREADENVVTKAVSVFARGLEQELLLELGERAGRAGDGVCVGGHGGGSFSHRYRRPTAGKTRQAAVCHRADVVARGTP
jgi:hypothetical protein